METETQLLNKRILIVDDDLALNQSINTILKHHGFINLCSAHSISDAIDIFSSKQIDFIILDVMLPDGEGYLLAKYIRKHSDVPILFLTAKDNPEDEIQGLKVGGDDYVTKPFLPKSLIYRIFALLRRVYKTDTQVCSIGHSSVDFKKAIIEQDGEIISITPIEIQILKKLYENKTYIVSTDMLCQAVWGMDHYGYENSLMVHIRNIRSKIEKNPSSPRHLITVKGLGYKLIP